MFVDKVRLSLKAGRGGNGVIAWRREKYIPKGGPCGGDGGKGGSIYIETDDQVVSLENHRNRRIIIAKNGQPGGYNFCTGKDGEGVTLKIPPGTLIKMPSPAKSSMTLSKKKEQSSSAKAARAEKATTGLKPRPTKLPTFALTEKKAKSWK
jgi:GTPase